MTKEHTFALYKGDQFIDLGTKEYLAKKLNVTVTTINYYGTKTYQARVKNNGYKVIWIRNEEDLKFKGEY